MWSSAWWSDFLGLYTQTCSCFRRLKHEPCRFLLEKNRRATAVLQSAEGYAISFSSHKTSPCGQAAIWFLQSCCVLKAQRQPPPTTCACLNLCVCVFSFFSPAFNLPVCEGVCLRKAEAGSLSVFVFILRAAITSCSWGPYMGKGAEQRQKQDLIGSEASVCEIHMQSTQWSHL